VAEGVEPRQPADLVPEEGLRGWTVRTVLAISTGTAALLSAAPQPLPLADAARAVAPRPMLLIAGAGEEAAVRRVRAAASEAVQVWELPGVGHQGGLAADPRRWTDTVGHVLDEVFAP
jgi:hypothetical protein